jgi:hypothetical protein
MYCVHEFLSRYAGVDWWGMDGFGVLGDEMKVF